MCPTWADSCCSKHLKFLISWLLTTHICSSKSLTYFGLFSVFGISLAVTENRVTVTSVSSSASLSLRRPIPAGSRRGFLLPSLKGSCSETQRFPLLSLNVSAPVSSAFCHALCRRSCGRFPLQRCRSSHSRAGLYTLPRDPCCSSPSSVRTIPGHSLH